MWSIRSRNENEKLRVRDKLAARGDARSMLFPFFARSIAGKLKSPLCNDDDETERFRYSPDIYQNSRHVANLDASASTSSISNNTREKNDIAVHRFFSLSPLLSLKVSIFKTLIHVDRIFHCPSETPCSGQLHQPRFPFILLFCSVEIREILPLPSKREIPSIHLECKLVCEWKERALFSTRPSFQPLFILFCPFVSFSS